jgi:hypothetical protein
MVAHRELTQVTLIPGQTKLRNEKGSNVAKILQAATSCCRESGHEVSQKGFSGVYPQSGGATAVRTLPVTRGSITTSDRHTPRTMGISPSGAGVIARNRNLNELDHQLPL